jgi:hypothetical protein
MTDLSMREAPLTFRTSLAEGEAERQLDTLGLLPCAEGLRDFIQQCGTPVSIGIRGGPGVGKTTLMNMLRGSEDAHGSGLLDGESCKAINFETAAYAQFNRGTDLALACLHALTGKLGDALQGRGEIEDLRTGARVQEAQERLEGVLRYTHTPVPKGPFRLRGTDGSRDTPLHEDVSAQMVAFRREFGELVNVWVEDDERRRIVVFVDDLDRVRPAEAVMLLDAIGNFIAVAGCVFVVAVDYGVVRRGVAEHWGPAPEESSGEAFYEKLIQVPFVLPASGYPVDSYIADLLPGTGFPGATDIAGDREAARFFVDIALCTVGRNPRNIKRAMNHAALLEKIRGHSGEGAPDNREAKVLYAMACMQIAWPELYEYFTADPTVDAVTRLKDRDSLESLPQARQLFERCRDRERVKADISKFFDTLFGTLDGNEEGAGDLGKLGLVLDAMALAKMTAADPR